MSKIIEQLLTESINNLISAKKNIEAENNKLNQNSINYSLINSKAKKRPICDHNLKNYDEYTQKIYLEFLAYFASLDDNGLVEKYIFIQRLINGVNCSLDLESIILMCKTIKLNDFEELFKSQICNDLIDEFIVDILIITNLVGTASKTCMECITTIASVLGLPIAKFKCLANLAKAILNKNDDDIYQCYDVDLNKFLCYFSIVPNARIFNDIQKIDTQSLNEIMIIGICFERIYISIDKDTLVIDDKEIPLNDVEKITFRNCTFIETRSINNRYSDILLHFDKCIFEGCFDYNKQFHSSWFEAINTTISDSKFTNIITNTEYYSIISISNSRIINTCFNDCSASTRKTSYTFIVKANESEIIDSSFEKCFTDCNNLDYGSYASAYSTIVNVTNGTIKKCSFNDCNTSSHTGSKSHEYNCIVMCSESTNQNLVFNNCNKGKKDISYSYGGTIYRDLYINK